jgi:hypothetical protein
MKRLLIVAVVAFLPTTSAIASIQGQEKCFEGCNSSWNMCVIACGGDSKGHGTPSEHNRIEACVASKRCRPSYDACVANCKRMHNEETVPPPHKPRNSN